MKDLYIYHPGTGTLISLSDPVYLIDNATLDDQLAEAFSEGFADQDTAYHVGWRIDNYNMTNLFFGEE